MDGGKSSADLRGRPSSAGGPEERHHTGSRARAAPSSQPWSPPAGVVQPGLQVGAPPPSRCSHCGAPFEIDNEQRCRWCRARLANPAQHRSRPWSYKRPAFRGGNRARGLIGFASIAAAFAIVSNYLAAQTDSKHAQTGIASATANRTVTTLAFGSSLGDGCGCDTGRDPTNPPVSSATAAPVVPIAPDLAAMTPTAPAGQAVPASCVTSVPFEETNPLYLNSQYFFELPSQQGPCLTLAGLQLAPPHPAGAYGHIHLDLDLQGGQAVLPAGIGADTANNRMTDLFTESSTGIVWFYKSRSLTLGQLFLEWGQPLAGNQIGSMHSLQDRTITWYVNGAAVSDPSGVVLRDHQEIQAFEDLEGSPINPTTSFAWPPGY